MKNIAIIILSFAIVSCSQQGEKTGDKETREVKQYTIGQFYKNLSIYGGRFSPDETKLLVTSNESGIYNVYALPVDGAPSTQITYSTEESVFAISYFPNDNRKLYSADKGGNEISHIYLLDEDNEVTDLTPSENAKANFLGWTRDKKGFFFGSNERDPRFFDLYEMDIESFDSKMMYQNNDGLNVGSISKDKKFLALTKSITTNNNEMYLFDVKSGEIVEIKRWQ